MNIFTTNDRKYGQQRAPRAHYIWPAVIAAGASIAGSYFGGKAQDKGQKAANVANLKIAREQMAFQERMSSTAYQRSAKDLSAAGLNRILALGSPASSPSGALATMQSETAGKADALKTGTASAMQARIAGQQFEQLRANTMSMKETAKLIQQQTANEFQKTGVTSAQRIGLDRINDAYGETVDPAISTLKEFKSAIERKPLTVKQLDDRNKKAGRIMSRQYKYDPKSVRSKPPPKE